MKIAKQFQVKAPIGEVWTFLLDPRQSLACMPGAELTEVQDERTFLGAIKVKVGPVTVGYKGKATMTEVDEARHLVRLLGEGREAGSGGAVKALITSSVVELPGGLSQVSVDADVELAGKIVQFGRSMIDQVSDQLFNRFVTAVRARLEKPAGSTAAAAGAGGSDSGGGAHAAGASAAGSAASGAGASAGGAAAGGAGAAVNGAGPQGAAVNGAGPHGAAASAMVAAAPAAVQPAPVEPIRILPIILRAFFGAIAGFFRKLFARGKAG